MPGDRECHCESAKWVELGYDHIPNAFRFSMNLFMKSQALSSLALLSKLTTAHAKSGPFTEKNLLCFMFHAPRSCGTLARPTLVTSAQVYLIKPQTRTSRWSPNAIAGWSMTLPVIDRMLGLTFIPAACI